MSDTTPEHTAGPTGPDRLDVIRAAARRSEKRARAAETERDALRAEVVPLRRQAALWRAGVKSGPAAELFLERLPDDLNLENLDAVRQCCASITADLLGAREQLQGVGT
jgi:hypothetical protein